MDSRELSQKKSLWKKVLDHLWQLLTAGGVIAVFIAHLLSKKSEPSPAYPHESHSIYNIQNIVYNGGDHAQQPAPDKNPSPSITPRKTSATTKPPPLSNRSVLVLPVKAASTGENANLTANFFTYTNERISSGLLNSRSVEVVNREDLDAINKELEYLSDLNSLNDEQPLSAEAFKVAARHGARWIFRCFLSIEPQRYPQIVGPDQANMTIRISVQVYDVMTRASDQPPFEYVERSNSYLVDNGAPLVKNAIVKSHIDSVCEHLFFTEKYKTWLKNTHTK